MELTPEAKVLVPQIQALYEEGLLLDWRLVYLESDMLWGCFYKPFNYVECVKLRVEQVSALAAVIVQITHLRDAYPKWAWEARAQREAVKQVLQARR